MKTDVDVLIVGGGPAGSSAAWGLRDSGLEVLVWDRAEFPRNKICAGWVTPQILEALDIDEAHYRDTGYVMQPIHGFRVSRLGDREREVDYGEVVSYGIRRSEFDHYLLERTGVSTRLGEKIKSIHLGDESWVINSELTARVLVGAGGHFCPVARHLGVTPGRGEPTIVATEIEFEMTPEQVEQCPSRPEMPELFFDRELRGYGWVVRKGERWLNVGVGRQDTGAFPSHVNAFIEWLKAERRIPLDLPRTTGHAYLLYDQAPRPLTGDGVFLVGDAAGLAYNPSGEGIRPAVESGLMAAHAIRNNAPLESYEQAVMERFGKRHGRVRRGLTSWLPKSLRGPIAGHVMSTQWFAKKVLVGEWFLHRDEPALRI